MTAFGVRPGSDEWKFANDGVLGPEWSQHRSIVEQYFKFAVVRNPWDRFVSGWKYLAATRDRSLRDVLQNPPAEGHDYRHLTRPQYVTLYDDAKNLAVDQLLRYEDLEADFRILCEKIGLKAQLPRVNARPHPSRLIRTLQAACGKVGARSLASRFSPKQRESYRTFFDSECRALFEQKFAEDIALLGYEF